MRLPRPLWFVCGLAAAAVLAVAAAEPAHERSSTSAAPPHERPSTSAAPPPRATPEARDTEPAQRARPRDPRARIAWRRSRALGLPYAGGRLRGGVQLPEQGRDWFTWDPVRKHAANRPWRRWGTARLLRKLLRALRTYRAADPSRPRVGVGDLSRPRGGEFGRRYGGLGHASHQNGLDVDVYYPRRDRRERRPYKPAQVDRAAAQALVDAFLAQRPQKLFVGPRLNLRGPRRIVVALAHHDDHLHVRIRPPG